MSEFPVKLPDVGEGVAEAELVSWAVEVGDQVTPDSALAEVLTDKATVEIACPVAGTITELRAQPGDVLAVGSIIVVIDSGEGGGTRQSVDAGDSRSADASAPSPAIPVTADRS
ncbi:MAG TPA: hypothetical protein PKV27_11925, partial [Ilumatobacteraceae bacterium]|nr:hypothetical protein [Ilumatobacteraceae bacterium]